jgi:hypothetical protein
MLEQRIKLFLASPLASLDQLALKREVDAIGRLRPDTAEDRTSRARQRSRDRPAPWGDYAAL